MNIILYYAPTACSLVPYVALTETGADFEVRTVNFAQGQHMSAEFLRLNPKHAVPVLLIDGEPLTENVAIQIWIARNFPAARLLPPEGMAQMRAIAFLAWCAAGIHPRLTPNAFPLRFCDLPGSEESVRRCAQKLLLENFAIAESSLTDGRSWFFEQFTTADIYFYWCFRRAQQFSIDLDAFPHCGAHGRRMAQRPSVQRLLTFEQSVLKQFAAS